MLDIRDFSLLHKAAKATNQIPLDDLLCRTEEKYVSLTEEEHPNLLNRVVYSGAAAGAVYAAAYASTMTDNPTIITLAGIAGIFAGGIVSTLPLQGVASYRGLDEYLKECPEHSS